MMVCHLCRYHTIGFLWRFFLPETPKTARVFFATGGGLHHRYILYETAWRVASLKNAASPQHAYKIRKTAKNHVKRFLHFLTKFIVRQLFPILHFLPLQTGKQPAEFVGVDLNSTRGVIEIHTESPGLQTLVK